MSEPPAACFAGPSSGAMGVRCMLARTPSKYPSRSGRTTSGLTSSCARSVSRTASSSTSIRWVTATTRRMGSGTDSPRSLTPFARNRCLTPFLFYGPLLRCDPSIDHRGQHVHRNRAIAQDFTVKLAHAEGRAELRLRAGAQRADVQLA